MSSPTVYQRLLIQRNKVILISMAYLTTTTLFSGEWGCSVDGAPYS